ncbi:MAG: peptidyl-prolyl cis-trans isomerase [Clostridiales bacterium]|nr:peptidyl-prolyl cis-trans isomerase [Clostridiales bacterium]
MKKRIGALLLALMMVMSLLVGCSDSTDETEDTTDSTASDTTDDSTEDSTDDSTEDTTTLTEVPDEAKADPIAYVTDGAISAGDTVITADGAEIPANLYFYWLTYYYNYYSYYYYYYYGYTFDVTEVTDEDEGTTVADTLVYMASNISEMYAVLNEKADEYGLILTEDQETSLSEVLANYDENALLYYTTNAEGLELAYRESCQATNLQDYLYGEGGEYEPTDETIADYAEEQGYYTCRYILLYTADLEDDDDGRAAQQEAAQAIYDALQGVSADELEDAFAEYQAESNYDENTDEYTFDSDDSLVDGFRELVETLEVGEVGMTDETDYGYFVILRLDYSEDTLAEIEEDYISDLYNSQIDEWMNAATFETSEALDGMDWQACFENIINLQTAIATEEEAAAAEEEAESEDTDTTEE